MKLILLFLGLTLFSCGDKDDAIKEVKELKDLLNLVILTQEEFDKKAAELKKIILGN